MSQPSIAPAEPRPPDHHDEIAQLIREIHEERQEVRERERSQRWTIWVSLSIVGFAVFAAIGSQQDNSVSTTLVIKQTQASDTWAYYQAKSIKARVAELEMHSAVSPAIAAAAKAEADKLKAQMKELMDKARALEAERDLIGAKDGPLSNGVAALQVAIALASVCLIVKRKLLWAASGAFGAVGISYVIKGLLL